MRISDWSSDVCSSDLLWHADLALRRARAVVLYSAEVDVDERNAGEHHDHDGHKYSVLDARRREHALVAFVGALRSGLEPFLDDDRHKGQRKHPAGHQHGPDAVVDDPGHEGEVVDRKSTRLNSSH